MTLKLTRPHRPWSGLEFDRRRLPTELLSDLKAWSWNKQITEINMISSSSFYEYMLKTYA